jgi:hypothetical protein
VLDGVPADEARRRLVDGTYDFSRVEAALEDLRRRRQIGPDEP